MAIKAVLESLDGLSEEIKGLYKEVDGKFVLQVEGGEDTSALKRAKDHEKNRRQEAEEKLRVAQDELTSLQSKIDDIHKGNVPKGDVDALEKSLNTRWESKVGDKQKEVDSLTSQLNTILVTSKATELAHKLAAKPEYAELLLPHITKRLRLETVDGAPITRVLDVEGKPSGDTLDDLEKALLQNAMFAPILRGSPAGGSGANGGSGGGGASQKTLSELTESERIEMAKKDPAKFDRLVAESKKR